MIKTQTSKGQSLLWSAKESLLYICITHKEQVLIQYIILFQFIYIIEYINIILYII